MKCKGVSDRPFQSIPVDLYLLTIFLMIVCKNAQSFWRFWIVSVGHSKPRNSTFQGITIKWISIQLLNYIRHFFAQCRITTVVIWHCTSMESTHSGKTPWPCIWHTYSYRCWVILFAIQRGTHATPVSWMGSEWFVPLRALWLGQNESVGLCMNPLIG